MNKLKLVVVLSCVFCFGCFFNLGPKGADTKEELMQRYVEAHRTANVDAMMRLYYTEDVPKRVIKYKKKHLEKIFKNELLKTKFTKLNPKAKAMFNKVQKVQGQTIAFNVYIDAQISADLAGNRAEGFLYGKKDGKYYFGLQVQKFDKK